MIEDTPRTFVEIRIDTALELRLRRIASYLGGSITPITINAIADYLDGGVSLLSELKEGYTRKKAYSKARHVATIEIPRTLAHRLSRRDNASMSALAYKALTRWANRHAL